MCGTLSIRWVALWQTVGGVQPTVSVSHHSSDPRQCGQLHLPQGFGERQLWQGTKQKCQCEFNCETSDSETQSKHE